MREIRMSGSEGGGAGNPTGSSYPYQIGGFRRQVIQYRLAGDLGLPSGIGGWSREPVQQMWLRRAEGELRRRSRLNNLLIADTKARRRGMRREAGGFAYLTNLVLRVGLGTSGASSLFDSASRLGALAVKFFKIGYSALSSPK